MSSTLVVVICHRDRWATELLCRTMEKYLRPCDVIFVLNEKNDIAHALQEWFEGACSKFLDKFNVSFYKKHDFWSVEDENHLHELELEGWVDQQVLKIAIANKIETEHYLVLDAKNFFVRPCYVEDIKQVSPEPTDWCSDKLNQWILTSLETFCLEPPNAPIKLTQNTTPYKMRTQSSRDLIVYFGGVKTFFKWFSIEARKEKQLATEFFTYELFTVAKGYRNLGETKANCIGVWAHMIEDDGFTQQDFVKYFIHMFRRYDVKVAGFHKRMYTMWTTKDAIFMLKRLGCVDCLPSTASPFLTK